MTPFLRITPEAARRMWLAWMHERGRQHPSYSWLRMHYPWALTV